MHPLRIASIPCSTSILTYDRPVHRRGPCYRLSSNQAAGNRPLSGRFGTVDLIYIGGVSDFYVTDVNLTPTGVAAGEGGRILYGTFDASGEATPNRRSYEFERVNELRTRGATGLTWPRSSCRSVSPGDRR
jgi:hypothetical protein